MKAQFAKRRDYVLERIARLPDVTCLPPGGAFYAFMNVSAHFGRTLGGKTIVDSTSFCMTALAEAHVALVMGSAFGAEGYARHVVRDRPEHAREGIRRPGDVSRKLSREFADRKNWRIPSRDRACPPWRLGLR